MTDGTASGGTSQYGFDCPNCGDTTVIETENGPEALTDRIFECDGCGENILLNNYVGNDRDSDTETNRNREDTGRDGHEPGDRP